MTTRSEAEGSVQQIWDQLDKEDAGLAVAPVPPETQVPVVTPAVTPDAAPESAAPVLQTDAPQTPTPAAQELLDKISGLESMLTQVTGRLRNAEGHIGNLNGQLKQTLAAASQVTARGADAPSADQIREAQGSAKAMEALKKDYPEFGSAVEAALAEQRQELEKRFAALPAAAPTTPGLTQADLDGLRGELQIESQHPGWKERVKTPEFRGWMERQPPEVQMLAQSDQTLHAIRLLDLHRDSTKAAPAKNTTQLDAAAAIPSGRAGATTRTKPVEEMTKAEYWAYQDSLERQKQG